MNLKWMGPVLFVKDIQSARRFYEGVLDQKVDLDLGLNLSYIGGLALWQESHAYPIIFPQGAPDPESHHSHAELCFETTQIDALCDRLKEAGVELVHPLTEQPWGQRTIRFYDFDGHMLEVGEAMSLVVARLLAQGLPAEAVAARTGMPMDFVRQVAEA